MSNTRPWITTGIALVGAGVVAVTPVAPLPGPLSGPLSAISLPDVQLTAADMVLDLVRHGQSQDNVDAVLGTTPPGAPLTDEGATQAVTVDNSLFNSGDYTVNDVYASEFLRTQQTAWPLIQLLTGNTPSAGDIPDGPTPPLAGGVEPSHILSGLNELNAGFLNDQDQTTLTGLLYLVAPIAWMFGQYWVPQLGSTIDPNGMAFETRFSDAIDQIYNNSVTADPTADGPYQDVAFSHAAAISTWVMMNVKNPDFGLYFKSLTEGILPNTGQVVVEGNPTDGWTLVSWNGQDVPQDPGVLTGLIVDFRDLITAPQMALYNIEQAFAGGDSDEISQAFQAGFGQVLHAFEQFPQALIDTFSSAASGTGSAAADSIGDALTSLAG